MDIVEDREFRDNILLEMKQREFSIRNETHCSDLCYCLTKQAFRRLYPIESSDEEILRFTIGWATQRWLTEQPEETSYVVDGITVTPDFVRADGTPWELKATYTSSTKSIMENQAWIRQIAAQCKVLNKLEAHLTRFEVMGNWKWVFGKKAEKARSKHPTLSAYKLTFTQEDIDQIWNWYLERKVIFERILKTGEVLPKPYVLPRGQEYECDWCPYRTDCEERISARTLGSAGEETKQTP